MKLEPSHSDYKTFVKTTSLAMGDFGPASKKTKPNELVLELANLSSKPYKFIKTFTQETIEEEGWYWFEPAFLSSYSGPMRFTFVEQWIIDEKCLTSKSASGNYTGPIDLGKIKRQEKLLEWINNNLRPFSKDQYDFIWELDKKLKEI